MQVPEEQAQVRIGLEVHCQLTSLKTKLFCGCPTDYRGLEANARVCPVCLGLPGTLPTLNGRAVEDAVKVALALNARVSRRMLFYRKNYFYPDMPKNFQISQYEKAGGIPLAVEGFIDLDGERVRVRRIQLEEDPGKISYEGSIATSPYTLVDYNRAGVVLVEIVTEPDVESPRQARRFLQKLRSITEHLGVCDGSLEGSIRCDANISLGGGKRVEIKNISSFKEVERALSFEITRQKALLGRGRMVALETRHWDDIRRITVSLRVKEEEQDYRYFPEPDLVPVLITQEEIAKIRRGMPELPGARVERFIREYGLPRDGAEILTTRKAMADFFEKAVKIHPDPKRACNWLVGEVLGYMNRGDVEFEELRVSPENFARLLKLCDEGAVSERVAKAVLVEALSTGKPPDALVEAKGLELVSDRRYIEETVESVFNEHEEAVRDALKDERAVHYLVGQVMKASGGRADPKLTRQIILERIASLRSGKR